MKRILMFILLLGAAQLAVAADLTGTWQCDDGGTYYLRQAGSELHWYGETATTAPRWSNVFDGRISGSRIKGRWYDVPKGQTQGQGELTLTIKDNGKVIEAARKSGGFGGSRWTRVGYQPQPLQPATQAAPLPRTQQPQLAPVKPLPMQQAQPAVSEDCISFDPARVAVSQVQGHWKIVDGSHWMFDFGDKRDEARNALRVIRHYRLNQSCFVGRPDPSLRYLLSSGQAPTGPLRGEDCVSFDPNRLTVTQAGGRWKVVDGSHWLFDFGDNRNEAETALTLIRKYAFSHSCFVGRPQPSFTYLRK